MSFNSLTSVAMDHGENGIVRVLLIIPINTRPGTFPTVASLKRIVDAHTKGFPTIPLVAMIAGFDAGWLGNTNNPPEIAHYILTQRNTWGPIGWRRDQWGATDNYLRDYLENNNRSFSGITFKTLIMDRWKTAPVTGEPPAVSATILTWKDKCVYTMPHHLKR